MTAAPAPASVAPDPGAADRACARLSIDLGAIADNWRRLRDRVAPAECAAVVKADAYGLGCARVAPALVRAGARTLFVAQPDEALALRRTLDALDPPTAEIALLSGVWPDLAPVLTEARITPVLNHLGELATWQAHARARGRALRAYVHLDTGMNRLGLGPDEQAVLAAEPGRLDGIALAGWLSHFACADEAGHPMTAAQHAAFTDLLARLPPAPASLANSSGIFRDRAFHLDLVRPGIALYGGNPTPERANPMAPVVTLQGRVLQRRAVDSGMAVGYGATHRVQQSGVLATIGIGYADGYLRALSSVGTVATDRFGPAPGRIAPVVGRVSMDLIVADVTGWPAAACGPGSFVEVIGPDRPIDRVAGEAGTISYEILTNLGRRYHRRWLDDVRTGAG